jgi:hypothetical protein
MWKPRWVVVKGNYLYWYITEQASSPEDVVSLKTATGVRREEAGGKGFAFVISFGSGTEVFAADDA